jgi:hypothetical protein
MVLLPGLTPAGPSVQNANWTQLTNQFTPDASTTSTYLILFAGFSTGTSYLDDVPSS